MTFEAFQKPGGAQEAAQGMCVPERYVTSQENGSVCVAALQQRHAWAKRRL